MKYYIAINNHCEGPFEAQDLLLKGMTPTTLVWTDGMTDWVEAGSIPELQELMSSARPEAGAAPRYAPGSMPPPPFNNPAGYPIMPCPKTWLVEAILVTLFCCLPFGIVAIVKSSNVETYWRQGMYAEAEAASRSAGLWTKLGFFSVFAIFLFYIIGIFCAGFAGFLPGLLHLPF